MAPRTAHSRRKRPHGFTEEDWGRIPGFSCPAALKADAEELAVLRVESLAQLCRKALAQYIGKASLEEYVAAEKR